MEPVMKGNWQQQHYNKKIVRLIMCILLQLRHCHYINYLGATLTTFVNMYKVHFYFINLLIDLIWKKELYSMSCSIESIVFKK